MLRSKLDIQKFGSDGGGRTFTAGITESAIRAAYNDFHNQILETNEAIGDILPVRAALEAGWSGKDCEDFLNKFVHSWTALDTFKSNNKEDIEEWINKYLTNIDLTEYEALNKFGFLSIKTLYQILMLLSGNEKSSRPDAFMFRTIITRIAEGDADLYDVVAWADCNKADIKWDNRR